MAALLRGPVAPAGSAGPRRRTSPQQEPRQGPALCSGEIRVGPATGHRPWGARACGLQAARAPEARAARRGCRPVSDFSDLTQLEGVRSPATWARGKANRKIPGGKL